MEQASIIEKQNEAPTVESAKTETKFKDKFILSHVLLCVGFILLNQTVFLILNKNNFYQEVLNSQINYLSWQAALIHLSAWIMCWFAFKADTVSAFYSLKKFQLDSQLLLLVAVLLSGVAEVLQLIANPSNYSFLNSFAAFAIVAVFISLLDRLYWRKFSEFTSFRLSDQITKVRLIDVFATKSLENANPFERIIDICEIKIGDMFSVKAGELIACDAVVMDGSAYVLESKYSAVKWPRLKNIGDEVFAGSRLVEGQLSCKVKLKLEDSLISFIEEKAISNLEPRAFSYTQLISKINLISIIVCCFFAYGLYLTQSLYAAMTLACTILVAASLSKFLFLFDQMPFLAATTLFNKAILLKDNKILKTIANIKNFIFDYPNVSMAEKEIRLEVLDQRVDHQAILRIIASLHSKADQEIDRDIVAFALSKLKNKLPLQVNDFHAYPGLGISGIIQKVDISIGTEDFLIQRGVMIQPTDLEGVGQDQIYYIASADELIAKLVIQDLGKSFKNRLLQLREIGVSPKVFAENQKSEANARLIGYELADIHVSFDSKSKLSQLSNDSFLLASDHTTNDLIQVSHVSSSFFDPIRFDTESTDVIFLEKKLDLVAFTLIFARKYLANLKQNIYLLISFVALLFCSLAFSSVSSNSIGLAVFFASLIIYLNSLRIIFIK